MSTPVRASLKGKPTLAEDYRIIDLFLRNPPRRLRLDERTLEITERGSEVMNRRVNLKSLAVKLANFGPDAPANDGLALFAVKSVSSTLWEDFTFNAERSFDLYCRWLLAVKAPDS